jgi:hypothetical protein
MPLTFLVCVARRPAALPMHTPVRDPTRHPTVPRLLAHTTALPPTAVTAVFAIADFLVPARTATGGSVCNTGRSGGDAGGGRGGGGTLIYKSKQGLWAQFRRTESNKQGRHSICQGLQLNRLESNPRACLSFHRYKSNKYCSARIKT